MADIHGVVRTDLMYGTDVRSGLASVKYMGEDGTTETEIDNGCVLKLGALLDAENDREIFIGEVPTGSEELDEVVLIATPELMYDERKHNLYEFYNEAGRVCRGYKFHPGDIFSVTAEALEGSPAVDSTVALAAGVKLEVDGAGTTVGTIIAEETDDIYTYYVVKVG
ncbi:MAG: hypothetical protein LUD69_07890 [Oscillospiraceae bacterium]|nr:hypothetical protein [Oscillospiraceae bacterium]